MTDEDATPPRSFQGIGAGALLGAILAVAGGQGVCATDPFPGRADGYYVRPVYFVASDETPTDPDWKAKLQTAWIVIQRFYADQMKRNGFEHRGFNLELEADGRPRIFLYRGRHDLAYYQKTHDYQTELYEIFSREKDLVAIMARNAPWTGGRNVDPNTRGGTAYVGDADATVPGTFELDFLRYLSTTVEGQMAIFRDESVPSNPLDPAKNWKTGAIASARIGGTAHELGHALGASHACEGQEFMSFGFYGFRNHFIAANGPTICAGNALIFNNSAFFRSETSYSDKADPVVEFEFPLVKVGTPISFRVSGSDSESGPAFLGLTYGWVMYHYADLRAAGKTFTYNYDWTPPKPLPIGTYGADVFLLDRTSLRTYRSAPFRVVPSIPPVPPAPDLHPNEAVFIEDALPAGTKSFGGTWYWNSTYKASGAKGLVHPTEGNPRTQVFFLDSPTKFPIATGDLLTAYVYIAPGEVPDMLAITWFKAPSGWSTSAYWGADQLVDWDKSRPPRVRAGDVPKAGGWVRLAVPASAVGLEGVSLLGLGLSAFKSGAVFKSGTVFWDRIGKVPGGGAAPPPGTPAPDGKRRDSRE